jgi:predicted AAA+ superfamily ATPase
MDLIAEIDVKQRIARENPWWGDPKTPIPEAAFPLRVYFIPFKAIALNFDVRRATVLLGPRRVGKTVIIKQLIHHAIVEGVNPQSILYASIDAPIYSGIALEKFLDFLPKNNGKDRCLVIFDEIQYLREWEVHLKTLVDSYPNIKFVASGSAAAALKLKSKESGAGRFSDFMLPPLTFYEFLLFTGDNDRLISIDKDNKIVVSDIDQLNTRFIDYLNYGGYPEAVLNEEIRRNAEQFIRNDIIDKVLLKDLPSLYGINEIQELNKLFSFLAYNAGNEATLENISRASGITKPTIKKYIEYLESAFLIIKLSTVDENCRTMQRERNFKIYLNNPSMRAALFSPVKAEETDKIGHLAESAIFSQWQHSVSFRQLRYARWKNGEVDIVYVRVQDDKPRWIGEIKWSDRIEKHRNEVLESITTFLQNHPTVVSAFCTTKTIADELEIDNRPFKLYPSALYCYIVGKNITAKLDNVVSATVAAAT